VFKSFHKHADAMEWARAMEAKADRCDLPVSIHTLNQFKVSYIIERYRDEVCIKKKSGEFEAIMLNAFLKTKIANMKLSQISASDFYSYREKRIKTVKPATINRELGIIKHAFDTAINEWGCPLSSNPLSNIKKLKMNNSRDRRLQEGEIERIYNAVTPTQNPLIIPVVRFALETAMRRGEILNIHWCDIDFEKRTLHIPIAKNGHARTIPLTDEAVEILKSVSSEDMQVFSITANALRLAWVRLTKRAKIDNLHFHDLRHEAVSRFFERGLSIPEVALISGHRSYAMLARYTHLRAEDIARKL